MSGFDPTWLDLREPADAAARNPALLAEFARAVNAAPDAMILDIGCGTGSTRRNVAPHLESERLWHLADNDPALLEHAGTRGGKIRTLLIDLNEDAVPVAQGGFVTASALFDLCSQHFIDRFVAELTEKKASLYAALNYDGRIEWAVPHALDTTVVTAFNAHQQSDKGFGPALGPMAGKALAGACSRAGMHVITADSSWNLAGMPDLQAAFHTGIADVVRIEGMVDWLRFRTANGSCVVGHLDVLALHGTG